MTTLNFMPAPDQSAVLSSHSLDRDELLRCHDRGALRPGLADGGEILVSSIVKEIAESHKGTITVRSEIGKGSVFTLVLPAVKD